MEPWPTCTKCLKRADSHYLRGIDLFCDGGMTTSSSLSLATGGDLRCALGRKLTPAMLAAIARESAPQL